MNGINEEQLLAGSFNSNPDLDTRPETDLGALAEHLANIANALRKTTGTRSTDGTIADQDPNAMQRRTVSGEKQSSIYEVAANPSPPPAYFPDKAMRRRRFSALAREAYALRRRRSAIFGSDELFGEPAWDILLDLYIAHSESKPVSVSSACIGSAAPPTTGLRWLGVLAEHQMILREHDPEDQRRVLVRLTDTGLAAMDEYFDRLSHSA